MKRLALVGFPDGLARQDIAPTFCQFGIRGAWRLEVSAHDAKSAYAD
jgi:hypothetical protein